MDRSEIMYPLYLPRHCQIEGKLIPQSHDAELSFASQHWHKAGGSHAIFRQLSEVPSLRDQQVALEDPCETNTVLEPVDGLKPVHYLATSGR